MVESHGAAPAGKFDRGPGGVDVARGPGCRVDWIDEVPDWLGSPALGHDSGTEPFWDNLRYHWAHNA